MDGRKTPAIEPPEGCYLVRRVLKSGANAVYWYYAPDRWRPKDERTKPVRLPTPNTPEWFRALAKLGLRKGVAPAKAGSISELWEIYKAGPNWPRAASSQRTYDSIWRNHIEPIFGDRAVTGPSAKAVVDLRNAYLSQPTTSRAILAVLASLFNEAVERGIREDNPAKHVRRLRLDPDGAKPLTPEAWAILTGEHGEEVVRRVAILGRATGQRISDLVKMRPNMREEGGLRHDIKKTNRASHFSPIEPQWAAIMEEWKTWPPRRYLDVDMRGKLDEAAVRRAWNRLAATEAGEELRGFTPHDLRATNFCDEILAGYTTAQVAKRRGVDESDVVRYTKHLDNRSISLPGKGRTEQGGNGNLLTSGRTC